MAISQRYLYGIIHTFVHKYFYSIDNTDDPQTIPDLYAANIENFIIRDRGTLEMRDGLTARGTAPNATNLGSAVLFNNVTNTKKLIRVLNGAGNTSKFQQSDDGVTWTDITGGGSRSTNIPWVFVQANQNLYGVNGTDTPIKFDGATITTMAGIPNGTAIEWWKNFAWVMGVKTAPDRLYFSNVNDPETFSGSDFININLGDNSKGVGLKGTAGSSGRLYIGKERSVWYVTGSSSATWALNILTYEHGVASHESMIEVKNTVWCVDLEGNVRDLYRTTTDNPFSNLASNNIQATIAGLNRTAITKCSAVYINNYALFFVANGVDDYNSLCLCYDTLANNGKGGWVLFTGWSIARATVYHQSSGEVLFLHDARTNNGQTYQWTGTSDNGRAILAKYETKVYDFGFPSQEKRYKFSYQYAAPQGSASSRFYVSVDRYYYTKLADVSLQGTGNKLLGQTWTLGTDKLGSGGFVKVKIPFAENGGQSRGTTMQVKLELESATTKLKLREFTSHYFLRRLH